MGLDKTTQNNILLSDDVFEYTGSFLITYYGNDLSAIDSKCCDLKIGVESIDENGVHASLGLFDQLLDAISQTNLCTVLLPIGFH